MAPAQHVNNFDVQSADDDARLSNASSQQRLPAGYMHASGQVYTVDGHDSVADHVIRGSLDAPPQAYGKPSHNDVKLKLKVSLLL